MKPRPVIPAGGTRWMAAFDTHGDQADPKALDAFHAFTAVWKPTVRICGGDHMDLRWLRGKASIEERGEDIQADVDACIQFVQRFKPTHYLFGNHDHRLTRALAHQEGAVRAVANGILDSLLDAMPGAKVLPYDARKGVVTLGDMRFIHGYSVGIGAVRAAANVYGNVAMGHLHRIERVPVDRLESSVGYCGGCLCNLAMDYARAQPGVLRWEHGWLYGVEVNGKNLVFQARQTGGRWLLPTEVAVI